MDLKVFLSISLSLHLAGLSALALLFPELKIDRFLPLHIEISLLPPVAPSLSREKPEWGLSSAVLARAPVKRIDEEPLPPLPPGVGKEIPVEEKEARPFENQRPRIESKEEEKAEKESVNAATPITLPSDLASSLWSDEKTAPLREAVSEAENFSIPLGHSHPERSRDVSTPDAASHHESRASVELNPPLSRAVIFVQPRYADNPKPVYPREARRRGYEGEVLLRVEVLMDGRVGRVEVKRSSGYEILDRSALTAVKQWRFIPANEGNGSVSCWVNIPIKFALR